VSVRTEALIRAVAAPLYTIAQIVIIPVILALGVLVAIVSIFNVLVFGNRAGAIFSRPLSRTSLFVRDALDWNFNNLDRLWRGPLSFFEPIPPL
jgi:hypothetical protein